MKNTEILKFQINKANKIHNNEYDYSLIKEYQGVMKKYPILCPIHGIWEVSLDNHINKKSKCPKCKGFGFTKEEKINQANKIHNNEYDYSLIIDNNLKAIQKVKIKHKICNNVFYNTWDNHVNKKQGCPKCASYGRKKHTLESIKEKISLLNNIEYEYDWDSYKSYYEKIKIKCPKHDWFEQQISNHLMGQKCPKCIRSIGEEKIENILKEKQIIFINQKKFDDCINPQTGYKLKFDFYIPSINLCIEYDGELHYKSVKYFGGDKTLEKHMFLDNIKNEYCKNNNINIIRISYIDINNINNILNIL